MSAPSPRELNFTESDIARFWSKVDRRDKESCWLWTGSKNAGGYGHFRFTFAPNQGTHLVAHRVAYVITYESQIPPGMLVCHHCDNRACVNPGHLFLGTQTDNMADMKAKGRQNYRNGERTGTARLSEQDVRDIRAARQAGMKTADIGAAYGIDTGHVSQICSRKIWAHVD